MLVVLAASISPAKSRLLGDAGGDGNIVSVHANSAVVVGE